MEFRNLHRLEISLVELLVRWEKVPDAFSKLASLKQLWWEGFENLLKVPEEFGNLHALVSLDLVSCVNSFIGRVM